jgi:hypothetical protein
LLENDYDAVLNATTASPEYKGPTQSEATFTPVTMTNSQYYWRVDEVESTIIKGDVWSFILADQMVLRVL